jgi:hypothetical protein
MLHLMLVGMHSKNLRHTHQQDPSSCMVAMVVKTETLQVVALINLFI